MALNSSQVGIIIIDAIITTSHCEKFKNSSPKSAYIGGITATAKFKPSVSKKQRLKVLLSNKFFSNMLLLVLQFTLCSSCINMIVKNTIVLAAVGE